MFVNQPRAKLFNVHHKGSLFLSALSITNVSNFSIPFPIGISKSKYFYTLAPKYSIYIGLKIAFYHSRISKVFAFLFGNFRVKK